MSFHLFLSYVNFGQLKQKSNIHPMKGNVAQTVGLALPDFTAVSSATERCVVPFSVRNRAVHITLFTLKLYHKYIVLSIRFTHYLSNNFIHCSLNFLSTLTVCLSVTMIPSSVILVISRIIAERSELIYKASSSQVKGSSNFPVSLPARRRRK